MSLLDDCFDNYFHSEGNILSFLRRNYPDCLIGNYGHGLSNIVSKIGCDFKILKTMIKFNDEFYWLLPDSELINVGRYEVIEAYHNDNLCHTSKVFLILGGGE